MFVLSYARPYVWAVAFAVLGCATPPATRTHGSDPVRPSDEITLEEITTVLWRTSTAADIVRALRPGMFKARYPTVSYSPSGEQVLRAGSVQVYVDNIPYGGPESLTTIPAASVRYVRRLTQMEAVARFGGAHQNGVIVVTTGVPDRSTR